MFQFDERTTRLLEEAYLDIRAAERKLRLEDLSAREALEKLQ